MTTSAADTKGKLLTNLERDLLDEARWVTTNERQTHYGHPLDNHGRCAEMWSTYLGVKITAEDVCWMQILLKVARQINLPTRDNLVDVVGYARNIEMIEQERKARAAKRKPALPYSRPDNV